MSEQWIAVDFKTSVNGGGSHPDGCLVAIAWEQAKGAGRVRVDVYRLEIQLSL